MGVGQIGKGRGGRRERSHQRGEKMKDIETSYLRKRKEGHRKKGSGRLFSAYDFRAAIKKDRYDEKKKKRKRPYITKT